MDKKKFGIIFLIKSLLFYQIYAIEYDISKGKNINQSISVSGFETKYATDGELKTNFRVSPKNYYSYGNAWIEIDLNGLYNITKIMLWTTNDNDNNLARNLKIYVKHGINYNGETNVQLTKSDYENFGTASNPQKASNFNFSSPEGIFGRYVWIGKDNEDLYLAEIAVLTESLNFGIINIKEISQNHNYYNFFAINAIDGKESTCSFTAQENEILRNITGWLKIDLGNNYIIHEMQVYDTHSWNSFSGFYKVYVDSSTTPTNLCFTNNQSSPLNIQYYKITCATPLTGRYVTFVKYANPRDDPTNRIDGLLLCEIRIFTTHSAKEFIYPRNYTSNFLTTNKQMPSTTLATNFSNGFNSTFPPNDASISTCQQNQIIIGILVGLFGIILGIIFIKVFQYLTKKRYNNQNENNIVIYEKPSQSVDKSHVYEDLHNNSVS